MSSEGEARGLSRRELFVLAAGATAMLTLVEQLAATAAQASVGWSRPFTTYGWIAQHFDPHADGYEDGHRGTDYHEAAGADNTVRSVGVGTVVYRGRGIALGQLGNTVVIQHASHWSLYAHLESDSYAQYGQQVLNGTPLGIKGDTGYSRGAHLHLEMGPGTWFNNNTRGSYDNLINPETLLASAPPAPANPQPIETDDMFTDADRKNLNDLVALAPTIHQINRRVESALGKLDTLVALAPELHLIERRTETIINEGRDRAATLARIESALS